MQKLFLVVLFTFLSEIGISMEESRGDHGISDAPERVAVDKVGSVDTNGVPKSTSTHKTCRVFDAFDLGAYTDNDSFLFRCIFSITMFEGQKANIFRRMWNLLTFNP